MRARREGNRPIIVHRPQSWYSPSGCRGTSLHHYPMLMSTLQIFLAPSNTSAFGDPSYAGAGYTRESLDDPLWMALLSPYVPFQVIVSTCP